MKSFVIRLWPAAAVIAIWFVFREEPLEPFAGTQPVPGLHAAGPEAVVAVRQDAFGGPAGPGTGAGTVSAGAGNPVMIPRTTAELNAFADGRAPLEEKMNVLAAMMRSASADDARAAAVRAVFVVKNEDYEARLGPLITDAALHPAALDVLSLNLYDRPLDLRLPVWAAIRNRPGHPLAETAADGLEFHLGDRAGVEGDALIGVVRKWLAENR